MDLDRNSVDGAGAMDDEQRRQIEEDLIRARPLLRHNPAGLRQMVDAITKGIGQEQEQRRQSADPEQSFFGDMQGWYARNVMPRLGHGSGQTSEALDSTGNLHDSDLSPMRGLETGFATENGGGATRGSIDPGQIPQQNENTVRHYPAPGRFAARRGQDPEEGSQGFFERGGMEKFRRGNVFARRDMGKENT